MFIRYAFLASAILRPARRGHRLDSELWLLTLDSQYTEVVTRVG